MVAFLDRFGSRAPGSVSVGSSLDSMDITAAAAAAAAAAADAEQRQEEVAAAVGKP
jgi:hypothetical protein